MDEVSSCEIYAIPYAALVSPNGSTSFKDVKSKISLQKKGAYLWLNLDYQDADTYEILTQKYNLSEEVAEALCDESTRPRYFRYGEGIVLIMCGINYNQGSDPEDMVSIRVWLDKDKIITLSHRRLKITNMMRQMLEKNQAPDTSMQFFLTLAQKMVDEINDAIIDITEATSVLEEKVIDTDSLGNFSLRDEISDLRRRIISIRRYTAPQKEIFISLQNDRWDLLTQDDRSDIREIYNDITKAVEDLDYSRDHLAVFHEELQSKMTISMTKIMYIISIVTVIFTPLTVLTGLLGVNVQGIPYAENDYAFAFVCLIMLGITILLVYLMKKLRWF